MTFAKRLGIAVISFALLGLYAPTAHAGRTCWDYTDTERALARKINRARANIGENRLTLDPQLSRVSRYHVREMLRRSRLYHTSLSTLGWRVTRWVVIAENIARAGSARRAFKLWMNSSLHRANILNRALTFVGVGAIRRGGNLWVTVTFEARENPGTRLSMPRC